MEIRSQKQEKPVRTLKMADTNRRQRWLTILKIAWPLIIANSFWNLQLTIDRVFLGQYSTESLAAAIAVSGVFWTPLALIQQTAAYLMTFVAQYTGAKEDHMIGPSVWHAIYISLFGGLVMIFTAPFAGSLFDFIGHAESIRQPEIDYYVSLTYSALPTALVAVASSFYTGLGQTKIIILINATGLVVNALFDYLLIFGNLGFPELGITGAGYATTLANWASAILGLALIFQKKYDVLYSVRKGWRLNRDLLYRYIKFGVPSGFQWALEGLSFTVFLVILGRVVNGDAALASSGIVVTVMMLAVLPALGVAQAVSVEVGRYLGEKRPDLAEESTWAGLQVSAMYIALAALSFILFPQFYLSWFENSKDPAIWSTVSIMVPRLLLLMGLFVCFDSVNLVFSFALKGAGDTRFVTLLALTMPWPLMVLPTWIFRNNVDAVYWAWGASSVYIIVLAFVFWRRFVGGKWKSMSVIHG